MSEDFRFKQEVDSLMDQYDQDDLFKQRFIGFCENAMEGKAEASDLERLIENANLSAEEEINES
jgi:hypothetical protein